MAHHDLKIFIDHFQPVVDGRMRSTVRLNDRNFEEGDTITLHEGYPDVKNGYLKTGRTVSARISYIDKHGLLQNHVCLSLRDVGILIVNQD